MLKIKFTLELAIRILANHVHQTYFVFYRLGVKQYIKSILDPEEVEGDEIGARQKMNWSLNINQVTVKRNLAKFLKTKDFKTNLEQGPLDCARLRGEFDALDKK